MIREMALALALGLQASSAAEDASPQAPVGKNTESRTDFSAGFERLVKLGMPSLEGAEWSASGDGPGEMEDYELREVLAGMNGNGWKLQVGGKPVFLPLGAVATKEVTAGGGSGGSGSLLGALFGRGSSKKGKSADLVTDAQKVISTLEDADKSKDYRSGLEYRGASSPGRLLLFATQLHQSGHPTEANRLANTLFNLGVNPEEVIDSAVSHLASRDLALVTDAFFTKRDWAAYERDLRTLTERYPRGWDTCAAVQMLLPSVTKRAAGTMPAKPTIEGATLNPEAIAALDAALQDSNGAPDDEAVTRFAKLNGISPERLTPDVRSQIAEMLSRGDGESSGGPWLIEEPPAEGTKDPWSRLKRLGLDALPALAAVANDDTLTFTRNASSQRSYYRSSQESAADRALAAYQSMDRPLTRGELACRLLSATLPGGDNDENGPQVLADSAMEFWKNHRGKNRLDLLLVFLADGDRSQASIASRALAEMPEDAAHMAFEKHVMESEDIFSTLDSVATYLKLRKSAARDFFTRYSAAFKAQADGVDLDQTSGGYMVKQAGGVDKYLKKLSLFVSGESPRKLVLELAKAEKPDIRQINSLAGTVAESSPGQFVPLYLEAAVLATHVETRDAFLSALTRHAYEQRTEEEEKPKDTTIPSAQIPNWTRLLEDERPNAGGVQLKLLAAYLIEQFHSPSNLERIGEINQLDPAVYSELILQRARDRVEGKSPTPLPDPEKVPAARVDEMLKQLTVAKPEAVHELAKSWPIEDRLAFLKWLGEPEHAAKIPASVIAARKLLTSPIHVLGGPPVAQMTAVMQSLELKPGDKIDYERLTNLANAVALAAKKHSGLVATFSSSPLDTGIDFQASRLFDTPEKATPYDRQRLNYVNSALENADTEAVVGIHWVFEREWRQAFWKLSGKTVTPPEPEILEKLQASFASLGQPESKISDITFSVLHRDDMDKLRKLDLTEEE